MQKQENRIQTGITMFFVICALVGLATGFTESLLSNYFKEAYDVNAQQRGFIEFPRELPGVISIFFIAGLSFMGNIKSAIVAQVLTIGGLLLLALTRPSFAIMLLFLFIYSTGMHMYLPLGDSIGLSLAKKQDMGRVLGRFNGLRMAFLMIAGLITYVGFKRGWFNYDRPILVFIIAAGIYVAVAILLYVLRKKNYAGEEGSINTKLVFRKEYSRYYIICALFGGRKQIMMVYSPWVLIDLLGFRTDTMSILAVVGSLIGVFFIPAVGKWIDKFGVKKIMIAEALAFIVIYIAYGFLSKWVTVNVVALTGIIMLLVYLLNIIDRMTAQFGMVRSIYMRSIALVPEDVTPSLSLGMSIDHIVAIAGSYVCGVIWYNWGPEYVFILAGLMSLMNLIVARGIKLNDKNEKLETV